MSDEATSYAIYNLKTGRLAARISPEGVLQSEGDPEAVARLQALMQRDIVISEHQITFDPHDADEEYDPYPEAKLCYKELRSAASPMLSPPLRCSLYAMASVSMGGSRSPLEVKCFA